MAAAGTAASASASASGSTLGTPAKALAKVVSNNTFPRPSSSTVQLAPVQPPSNGRPWVFGLTVPVTDYFDMGKKLGEGGHFGFCKLATEKKTGRQMAVKHILKQRFSAAQFDQFRREVAIMERLNHTSVIQLHSAYEDDTTLYIAMEYCAGGEMFDRIAKQPYSEKDAANLLRQIFEALEYLHANGIAHCDLKPDNFIFSDKEGRTVKVIDFGLSKFTKRRVYFHKYCGTSFYVAPEVCLTEPHFNEACDMWSMGVVTFVMLFGYPPFHDDSDAVIIQLILQGFDPTVREGYGAHFPAAMPVSAGARDFIARLLELDVAKRMTAAEALAHPWLRANSSSAASTALEHSVFESLRGFLCRPRLKAAVLRLMTDSLSDYEVDSLQKTFKQLDLNRDGQISINELHAALHALLKQHQKEGKDKDAPLPTSAAELEQLMKSADIDGNGSLSYEELMLSYVNRKLTSNEERLWMAFRKLDTDNSGAITADEVFEAMRQIQPKTSKDEMKRMLSEVDVNRDGKIDYEEWLAFMWEKEAPNAAKPVAKPAASAVAPAAATAPTAAAAVGADGKSVPAQGAPAVALTATSASFLLAAAAAAPLSPKLGRQPSVPHPILTAVGIGAPGAATGAAAKK